MAKTITDNHTNKFFQSVVLYCYLILFFLTPLLVSIKSTELFEFPKMLFVYAMTGVIAGLWLTDMAISGAAAWKRSWVDVVLAAVLGTQLISSVFSLDRYTSFLGYYSRFHGGFLSTLCYVLLAWIFVRYATKAWLEHAIISLLASASLVSIYGIGEHFGIDAQFWVQDVRNRVFSTLGQPNWLAAWLGALLPFAYMWFLRPPKSYWPTVITLNSLNVTAAYAITFALTQNPLPISGGAFAIFIIFYASLNGLVMWKARWIHERFTFLQRFNFLIIIGLMQLALLFTKSRSGILALMISTAIFLIHEIISSKKYRKLIPLVLTSLFLILVTGTEWTPSLAKLAGKSNQVVKNPLQQGSTNPGISDSSDIRRVVWQGAQAVWQQYPLIGSGTETFAYSYYNVRPKEHNLNSEWDFLYNKAHNEYLNYLANNGLLGTMAILAVTAGVVWYAVRRHAKDWAKVAVIVTGLAVVAYLLQPQLARIVITKLFIYPPLLTPLGIALALAILLLWFTQRFVPHRGEPSGWEGAFVASMVSIVVTNFYGFSVVTVGLLFFMLPVWLVLSQTELTATTYRFAPQSTMDKPNSFAWIGAILGIGLSVLAFVFVTNYYQADLEYNRSEAYLQEGEVLNAARTIDKALQLHPWNANYWLHKGLTDAQTAFVVHYTDASDSAGLVQHYIASSVKDTQTALLKNHVHVNLYKSAARVYMTLGVIDPNYTQFAVKTLELARKLSPTDPQLPSNIALLKQEEKNYQEAEKLFYESIELKPDYLQAYFLLAQMYEKQKEYGKAAKVYQRVLDTVDPIDITSTKKLEEFREKKLID